MLAASGVCGSEALSLTTAEAHALFSLCVGTASSPLSLSLSLLSLHLAMDAGGGKEAWANNQQREEPGGGAGGGGKGAAATSAAAGTTAATTTTSAAAAASSPPNPPPFDISSFSLFPSSLCPSPHHHAASHSIVTLSAAAPSLVPPSPLLSESPTLAPQRHQHLGNEHILSDPKLIVNVWQSNLQEELAKILNIVDDYPFIAMVSDKRQTQQTRATQEWRKS